MEWNGGGSILDIHFPSGSEAYAVNTANYVWERCINVPSGGTWVVLGTGNMVTTHGLADDCSISTTSNNTVNRQLVARGTNLRSGGQATGTKIEPVGMSYIDLVFLRIA